MQPSNIPSEMLNYPNWVLWKGENRGGSKLSKIPYDPKTYKLADVTSSESWSSFEVAWSNREKFDGIGFVFSKDDPYCVIDLDYTTDPEAIRNQQWITNQFESYSEISPSGKGLHIIVKAALPTGRRTSFCEIYSQNRFMTMTGNVYRALPIIEAQAKISMLWSSFPTSITPQMQDFSGEQIHDDRTIYDKAAAAENGKKFLDLWNGDIITYHGGDHSAADFALINIISFYTQNRIQIIRLFHLSALGKRPKAYRQEYLKAMIDKSFDRLVPSIDYSSMANGISDILANHKKQFREMIDAKKDSVQIPIANPVAEVPNELKPSPKRLNIPLPPGLVGEIAKFIYAQSYKQVEEISITGALGLMAGICGRAWNINSTGLNLYLLLLAETGRGKEEIQRGVSKLTRMVSQVMPCFNDVTGPADLASGQALVRYLSDHPTKSFLSIFGEFGIKLKQISNPKAFGADQTTQKVILDLFGKSGAADVLNSAVYSDSLKNTKPVESPAFSMIGESVPDRFYDILNDDMLETGLLPRFLVVEYKGERPESNELSSKAIPPQSLIEGLCTLTTLSLKLLQAKTPHEVKLDATALSMSRALDRLCDQKINSSSNDAMVHLWNRVHLKTLRVAALLAVGNNPYEPIINEECFQWAQDLNMRTVELVTERFVSGCVGADGDEHNQYLALKNAIEKYLVKEYHQVSNYVSPKCFQAFLVPYSYLNDACRKNKNFKNDRNGATVALKRTIANMKDSGELIELPEHQLSNDFGYRGRAFALNPSGLFRDFLKRF